MPNTATVSSARPLPSRQSQIQRWKRRKPLQPALTSSAPWKGGSASPESGSSRGTNPGNRVNCIKQRSPVSKYTCGSDKVSTAALPRASRGKSGGKGLAGTGQAGAPPSGGSAAGTGCRPGGAQRCAPAQGEAQQRSFWGVLSRAAKASHGFFFFPLFSLSF